MTLRFQISELHYSYFYLGWWILKQVPEKDFNISVWADAYHKELKKL
ncbi:hypothetical protein LCGC14_1545560 [marine sediment metagenome]|uniref:Uncharacterized protein n=1 Tax=marine sediment metagenome TaxID=412755 RepID=A0A0F9LSM3_9ZZZZ